MPNQIKEGFHGQKLLIVPPNLINNNPLLDANLYLTNIGFYPDANFHYVDRPKGYQHHILIYCLKGEGWCEISGERQIIHANEFFVIPANIPHTYGCEDSWQIYWVHFNGKCATKLITHISSKNGKGIKMPLKEKCIKLFEEMIHALEIGYSHGNIGYINMSLYHLLGFFIYRKRILLSEKSHNMEPVDLAIYYMKENIDSNLSLSDIADHIGLSSSYFSTIFKDKIDSSPLDFFIQLKIQQATRYLVLTELKIKDISRLLGYNDPYYFSRIFCKTTGLSPRKYRIQHKA